MADDNQKDENTWAAVMAAMGCFVCLLIVYGATRPIIWMLHTHWKDWLLAPLFTLVPLCLTFTILYRGSWHLEWFGLKRFLLAVLTSCLIFVIALFVLAFMAMIGASYPRLPAGH